MQNKLALIIMLFTFTSNILIAQTDITPALQPYMDVIQNEGEKPIDFVLEKFDKYDLLIFDDALHTAVEPFEFYQTLIKTPEFHNNIKKIFIEVIQINKQGSIDDYMQSEPENVELLYPAFQDDLNGQGWPYKTYFDLLHTIYTINKSLPENQRLEVIAVGSPTYWPEIKSKRDLEFFRKTLRSYDYTMYITIADEMGNFKNGSKGIFLTNTRHAYKGIKSSSGKYYWNVGTFLYQWYPEKTYSVHFHNVYLFFKQKDMMNFDRIAKGKWDAAFKANGDVPVAIPLKGNVFGQEDYIGNHMLNVAPGQTMYDAYDAVIFLAPLETLRRTAMVDFIYTEAFKKELQRRAKVLYTEDEINNELTQYGMKDIMELIDALTVYQPEILLPEASAICPIDSWKKDE